MYYSLYKDGKQYTIHITAKKKVHNTHVSYCCHIDVFKYHSAKFFIQQDRFSQSSKKLRFSE